MSRYEPGQDTLDRYVQQRLNDNEREQFEIWLLDHPEVLEDLKLRSAMRRGVKALGEEAVEAEPPKQPRWWERWLGSPAHLGATAMACLALMVTPTAMFLAERQKTDSLEEALAEARQPKPILQRVPLVITRSATDRPNARGGPFGDPGHADFRPVRATVDGEPGHGRRGDRGRRRAVRT